ncbi:uncharacterized protein A4U43_C05F17510 [Asparagus officinalis]|uniref:Nuclear nucleic acid-binding protein C1D n=1 Tax=Asparagus officinalis TaxID=4686 RepID=A0A5P1EXQ1_ASPOF|nr:nuclear nucleic acid-binding protein C1D [Asparagus officinalis]XP_020268578.1 nuclear nucleic acid-binding protein C1D [Asparagus officinalis]ONK68930.1 uncharacterized protein A4U43_C05F17510 [Asparagus officinalis]
MAVPESVLDSMKETLACVDDLETNLLNFLSAAEPDVLAALPPLERARAYLVLSQSASALLAVKLRCSGLRPDDHPIKTEIERLSLCEGKLENFSDWNKAPLRPSTTINRQAATRFIEHSLPDLTPGQRHSMREISRQEDTRSRFNNKRKHSPSEKQSVRAAAQEFLEKAARELLGSNDHGMKGPLRNEISDKDDGELVG